MRYSDYSTHLIHLSAVHFLILRVLIVAFQVVGVAPAGKGLVLIFRVRLT